MTPAAWGVPTASERGDRIRIGPQVGKVATSPLPPRGSPPLQSGGTESEVAHKWARWPHHPCRLGGSPPSHSGGTESEVAHKWARWLHHPCRLGGSPPLQSGRTESEVAHKWARWLHHPCRLGVPTASQRGDRFKSGPQVGKVVTSPLAPRGSPPLQSGGQNQKWPTSGQGGYITPATSGGPHRFRAGDRIRSGPQVGKVATSPLPPGCPHSFRAGKQNQKWPTSGQGGYITPAVWGVPTASERGDRIRIGPQVGKVATCNCGRQTLPLATEALVYRGRAG